MATSVMWMLLALLANITLSAHAALQHFDCGPATAPVTVHDVVLKPDPAVSGEEMSFEIAATTDVAITSGTVVVIVLYLGIPVHIETDPLCTKTQCPVAAGDDFIFKNSQPLPSVTPAGSYTVRVNAIDASKKVLFCQRLQFQIKKPAGPSTSLLSKALSFFKQLLAGQTENVGAVLDAAEAAWKFPADTKAALKAVLEQGQALSNNLEGHWDTERSPGMHVQ